MEAVGLKSGFRDKENYSYEVLNMKRKCANNSSSGFPPKLDFFLKITTKFALERVPGVRMHLSPD